MLLKQDLVATAHHPSPGGSCKNTLRSVVGGVFLMLPPLVGEVRLGELVNSYGYRPQQGGRGSNSSTR